MRVVREQRGDLALDAVGVAPLAHVGLRDGLKRVPAAVGARARGADLAELAAADNLGALELKGL